MARRGFPGKLKMSIESLGQRLLNPFRGVVYTLRYGAAEAVTTDGVRWDIYVSNLDLLRGLDTGRGVGVSDIRYGNWTAGQGLKRGPLYPSEDFRRMEALGALVYEQLTRRHREVPFPLRDDRELWLLCTHGRPLALLASALPGDELDLGIAPEWRAGFAARESFASAAAPALVLGAECAGDCLARHVNARAGEVPAAQWFQRHPDGSGTGLGGIRLRGGFEGRILGAAEFPPLFIAAEKRDDARQRLIEDYHDWQAPWLLTLPDLGAKTRIRFERVARRRPFLVERLFRLYSEILDDAEIQAARVEAALRRAASGAGPAIGDRVPGEIAGHERMFGDDAAATFYIELYPRGVT